MRTYTLTITDDFNGEVIFKASGSDLEIFEDRLASFVRRYEGEGEDFYEYGKVCDINCENL